MGRSKFRAAMRGTFLFLGLVLIGQACGGGGFIALSDSKINGDRLDLASHDKLECQFVGVNTLGSRMSVLLEIPGGDVPVLDDLGTPTSLRRLATSGDSLGKANPSTGKFADFSCSTTKFKTAIEVMIDACAVSLSDPKMRAKFFPRGASDFTSIYQVFTGRAPSLYESQVLFQLSNLTSTENRDAAVCAAVASSLESLITI